jgi:hypothetical protein
MGLKDRVLDFIARWGSPAMDHPARGGMTGENTHDAADEADAEADADEPE